MGVEDEDTVSEGLIREHERKTSPYNLVFDCARTLKEGKSIIPNIAVRQSYLNWANELLNCGALVVRPAPLRESFERPLLEIFCEQLADLGAEVSREDREFILNAIMDFEARKL